MLLDDKTTPVRAPCQMKKAEVRWRRGLSGKPEVKERNKMAVEIDLKEMLESGVHFGHKKDRWNPKMGPYIYTERNGVHIFDLTITKKKLQEACEVVNKVTADGGTVLFVGTKNQVQGIVREAAEAAGAPFLTDRWPGGMLTNFQTIVKRLQHMEDAEVKTKDMTAGITKKERLALSRELAKLNATFEGVKDMRKLPELIFVSDIVKERIAVREAKKAGIPVIGIADTNANPDIEYVIPANDDAVKSVKYIVEKIAGSIVKPKATEEAAKEEEKIQNTKEKTEKETK